MVAGEGFIEVIVYCVVILMDLVIAADRIDEAWEGLPAAEPAR